MGAYLKGIDKIPRCHWCEVWSLCYDERPYFNEIKSECPLVIVKGPHGDLVDNEKIGEVLQALEKCEDIDRNTLDIVRSELWKIPTVIEAEGK